MIEGLPPLPPSVRADTPEDRQAYRTALGFEQILLSQLVEEMVPKGTLTDGPYAAPLQDALTSGLIADGGIGLGAQLYPLLKEKS